ncbi:DUF5134 domain-containing protein [Streptomyces sp. WMMB 322]|uniref:DUF5134 domain-containing protein n=1 Tax=Streptomyces sp. WMMB 322 TaxID=1286821 RepID=UPI0006E45913|nr:DUF5134 domain-containing protein [Streptomyces sp. WMMB 322]SCK57421.1 hypothetical protein H180DRAFT_05391 [Streptomyces sp. WMMB 322]
MHGSATVGWLLTALCAFVACVCLLRARGAGGMRRRTARSEALMGLGMAAMALPGSVSAGPPPLVLVLLFAGVGARELTLLHEARRAARPPRGRGSPDRSGRRSGSGHHLHHLVGALAMIYMALAMPGPHGAAQGGHTAGAAPGLPLLTGALLVYYAAYVMRTGLLLLPAPARGAAVAGAGAGAGAPGGDCPAHDRPELASACRVAMGIGMLAMLVML